MTDGRKLNHETLEAYRISGVKLYRNGVPVRVIAESFGVTRKAEVDPDRWNKIREK